MEAVYREAKTNRTTFYLIGASVLVCAWAYSLDSSTTSYYSIDASSHYKQHSSVLATLSVATNIISAVAKPFIAKISDNTSRPYTYFLALMFYTVGYIVAASSQSISAYVTGESFVAVGGAGLDLINDIIVADLTPLEWRGFVSSLLSTPFIINTWFAGKIVDAISSRNQWRWGYGMFAIIMPAVLTPAIATLIYLDRQAKKHGIVNMASSNAARRAASEAAANDGYEAPHGTIIAPVIKDNETFREKVIRNLEEIDALGLLLLGFGWALLLLPFSLKTYAVDGWKNPSMIAMMVVGGILLIAYVVYEILWARVPSAPRRLVFNKTFLMAIIIDSFYMRKLSPTKINSAHTDHIYSRWSTPRFILGFIRVHRKAMELPRLGLLRQHAHARSLHLWTSCRASSEMDTSIQGYPAGRPCSEDYWHGHHARWSPRDDQHCCHGHVPGSHRRRWCHVRRWFSSRFSGFSASSRCRTCHLPAVTLVKDRQFNWCRHCGRNLVQSDARSIACQPPFQCH